MALQINWTNPKTGVNHPTAYVRILPTLVDLQQRLVECRVLYFHDLAVAKPVGYPTAVNDPEMYKIYFATHLAYGTYFDEAVIVLAGNTLHIQWYKYLKTLGDFRGSQDA